MLLGLPLMPKMGIGISTRGGGGGSTPVDTTTYMTDKDGAYVLDKQGNKIEIKE